MRDFDIRKCEKLKTYQVLWKIYFLNEVVQHY